MKNKCLITLLCIFVLALPALGATVSIGSYNVAPNGSVVAPMIANGVTSSLAVVTVSLTYNPAIVQVTSIGAGTVNAFPSTYLTTKIDNSAGLARVVVLDLNGGKSGDVIIANIALTAIGSAGTSSPLGIGIDTFKDSSIPTPVDIPVTPVNGVFNIASGTSGNSGGGGGGGGGGGVTGEAFDNIAKSESYDKDLVANTPVTYTFKATELGVYEIALTDKENELGITLKVEGLKDTSKQVTSQAPGTVYKNMNILAGTSRMKEALIRFRVPNSWLGSNSLAASDVKLLHWDGSQWTQLETAQTTKDDTYTYYEAKTTTLSPFAISGIKGVVVPTATPVAAVTQAVETGTGTPSPSATKKVPAFEFVLAIAIFSAAYLYGRKRR